MAPGDCSTYSVVVQVGLPIQRYYAMLIGVEQFPFEGCSRRYGQSAFKELGMASKPAQDYCTIKGFGDVETKKTYAL